MEPKELEKIVISNNGQTRRAGKLRMLKGYVGGTPPGSSIPGRASTVRRSALIADRLLLLFLFNLHSHSRLLLGLWQDHFISPFTPISFHPLRYPTTILRAGLKNLSSSCILWGKENRHGGRGIGVSDVQGATPPRRQFHGAGKVSFG